MAANIPVDGADQKVQYTPYVRLMVVFLVLAIACIFIDYRLQKAGDWLPAIPETIGYWTSTARPLQEEELTILGRPKYLSREYTSPVGDPVQVIILAANSMDAYHDPRSCSLGLGYALTAEKVKPLQGAGNVRAMVFRNGDKRVIMYYWLQDREGGLSPEGAIRYDLGARLASIRSVLNTAATGRQTCIVRVHAPVSDTDPRGARARRNVEAIALEICKAMRGG
jgi:EpsI family protein